MKIEKVTYKVLNLRIEPQQHSTHVLFYSIIETKQNLQYLFLFLWIQDAIRLTQINLWKAVNSKTEQSQHSTRVHLCSNIQFKEKYLYVFYFRADCYYETIIFWRNYHKYKGILFILPLKSLLSAQSSTS